MSLPYILYTLFLLQCLLGYSQITTSVRKQPDPFRPTFVHACCKYIKDPPSLLHCSNVTANANKDLILEEITRENRRTNGKSKKPRLGIVTFATRDIWNYSAYALAVNEAYAEHNGYIFQHLDPESGPSYDTYDARWSKVKILEDSIDPINGWARDLDFVMWIDADFIFLDMGLRLEEVAEAHPGAHIIASAEHAGSTTLINSGTVLIRNSQFSREFLADWWNFADRKLYSDQEQFDLLYNARVDVVADKIAILPPDALNTDPPAMTMQKPYNQVLHLMGEHTHYRARVFGAAFHEICRLHEAERNFLNERKRRPNSKIKAADGGAKAGAGSEGIECIGVGVEGDGDENSSSLTLAHQLTVTRERLLEWTLSEYSTEALNLLKDFEMGSRKGLKDEASSRRLANSVHHYAHGLAHSGSEENLKESWRLRKRVYKLLYKNVQNRRKLLTNKSSAVSIDPESGAGSEVVFDIEKVQRDWPEQLKIVAEAGQQLLEHGSIKQRRKVAAEVYSLLEEMLSLCHPQQRSAVLMMVSHIEREIALIHIADNKATEALKHFEQALRISRELANQSGEHILVAPISMLANTLAMMGRFDEAFPLFHEAIQLAEIHVGSNHESISQLLVNLGIALVQTGQYTDAEPVLRRSLHILDINGNVGPNILRDRAEEHLMYINQATR